MPEDASSPILDTLQQIVASLQPASDSSEADRLAASAVIARALASGQDASTLLRDARPEVALVREIKAARLAGPQRLALADVAAEAWRNRPPLTGGGASGRAGTAATAVIRHAALRSHADPLALDAARGMAAAHTYGPFVDANGAATWIDDIPALAVDLVPLLRGASSEPFALLPVAATNSANSASHLVLASGSAWFNAHLLADGCPPGSWVGLQIKHGAIDVLQGSGSLVIEDDAIRVPAGARLRVDLWPKAGLPLQPQAGPGEDATRLVCQFPEQVSIDCLPEGLAVADMENAALTVYGAAVALEWENAPAVYAPLIKHLVIPCQATPQEFGAAEQRSTLFSLSGTAALTLAGWALPVTQTTPDLLGQADGCGALGLALGPGLKAQWPSLGVSQSLAQAVLALRPGELDLVASVQGRQQPLTFELWGEAAGQGTNDASRRSSLAFHPHRSHSLFYCARRGHELIRVDGAAVGHFDRPVSADGLRCRVATADSLLMIVQDGEGTALAVNGMVSAAQRDDATFWKPSALALHNALLKVTPPAHLSLEGKLTGTRLTSGTARILCGLLGLLPTLPDPYAATFDARQMPMNTLSGIVVSSMEWDHWHGGISGAPKMSLDLQLASWDDTGSFNQLDPDFLPQVGVSSVGMLDVSTHSDHWGVVAWKQERGENWQLEVKDLWLRMAGAQLLAFCPPAVTWEPMRSTSGPAVPLPPGDGPPTALKVETVHMVRVAPEPLLAEIVEGGAASRPTDAVFSLPLGLWAHVVEPEGLQQGLPTDQQGQLVTNRPVFSQVAMTGGQQIRLLAPKIDGRRQFKGWPHVRRGYGEAVLGKGAGGTNDRGIAGLFDDYFGPPRLVVPVSRIDLSGYGASLVSRWNNLDLIDSGAPGIARVEFETYVGRTSHMVVQAVSTIVPWDVRVQRSITMDRQKTGYILREDSGWQAITNGDLSMAPENRLHRGAIVDIRNVRNIRTTGKVFPITVGGSSRSYQAVTFDADVKIDANLPVVLGAAGDQLVPARGLSGFLVTDAGNEKNGQPEGLPTWAQLGSLLATRPVGGPLACTVAIGGPDGPRLRVAHVQVTVVGQPGDRRLVAALRGSPVLPRDGSWSMARQGPAMSSPIALDPQQVVPLVRKTGTTSWVFADAQDIDKLSQPTMAYGLLQASGTQKTFFPGPKVEPGETQFRLAAAPKLADIAALLNATGIFPDLSSAIALPAGNGVETLPVDQENITLERSVTVQDEPRLLMDLGAVKVELEYSDGKNTPTVVDLKIDPTGSPRWSFSMRPISFAVRFPSLGEEPLLRLVGGMEADEHSAATLTGLDVQYGSFLEPLQSVFSQLQRLAQFLPGGAGAGLQVSFSAGRLRIRNEFALPTLPLGIGYLADVGLDLGFDIDLAAQSLEFIAGIGRPDKPFNWLASPFAGTGAVQIGARNGDLMLLVQAGIGAGLGIDVGIASGSATVVLALQVDNQTSPFMLRVLLTGTAAVEVLGGVASASITLTAMLGVTVNPLPDPLNDVFPETITIVGGVAIGIHISVCWVVDIDFDGAWAFSHTFDVPDVPGLTG